MDEISGWLTWGVYLATSGCFDLVGRCCRVMLLEWLAIQTGLWPLLGLFICSQLQTLAPENTTCGKKMIGWKIDLFFKTENFQGFLDRLCVEPMRRSHDFLSLTLGVVGSTFGSFYFLLQCQWLWVCVLCF